jgi:hypothetical protein
VPRARLAQRGARCGQRSGRRTRPGAAGLGGLPEHEDDIARRIPAHREFLGYVRAVADEIIAISEND